MPLEKSPSPNTRPRSKKKLAGCERREAILEASVRLFLKNGFHATSFTMIAEEVGLSVAGLTHYFPTKVELLLAVLDKRDQATVHLVPDPIPHWDDFLAALKEINRRNVEIPETIRAFSLMNAESLLENHPAKAWFHKRTLDLRDRLAHSIHQAIDEKEIRDDTDPQSLASEIIAMMDGLQMLWLRFPQSTDMVVIFDAYLDRLNAFLKRD
ncbi:TetR/AcrR family transcriptional regulator [Rhizobium paknamense]|uniref:AcrR family transcriptional regulator n=1 Tax=Rhizobium paknamense TaxID=1206817 RepID=A0ABU0IDY9_9HYPH|nr:TetR/AcrR family transcriptional regulator [Rhizobium paknamense]MDQ0456463.1 AcrR family transcriptional regulator [Rhizobium paknamense]